jgi:DNA ligase (NAD+)
LVVVEKAGKIIPHVLRVNESARSGRETPFEFPTRCPECQSHVQQDEGGVYIRCSNPACPAQLRQTLIFFASRPAMNIDGLGEEVVNRLIKLQMVDGIPSLYRLMRFREKLIKEKGFKDLSVDNFLNGLEASKKQPLWRLLTAINIRHVGQTTARRLETAFGTLDEIASQSVESLSLAKNVGPVVAKSVHDFFHSQYGVELLSELKALGLNCGRPPTETTGKFMGKSFVVTGTLPTLSRDEAEQLIRDNGGRSTASVSKNTSFVLAGESAGSKLVKAINLGISVISEAELRAMIEQ